MPGARSIALVGALLWCAGPVAGRQDSTAGGPAATVASEPGTKSILTVRFDPGLASWRTVSPPLELAQPVPYGAPVLHGAPVMPEPVRRLSDQANYAIVAGATIALLLIIALIVGDT